MPNTHEIPEPTASFVEAVNRHDEEAVLSAFGVDGDRLLSMRIRGAH